MKKFIFILVGLSILLSFNYAYSAPSGKCEGPDELCALVKDLQEKLEAQKDITKKTEEEKSEIEKKTEQEEEKKTATVIAGAATLAVFLRIFLQFLKKWKNFPDTDKGKALLRAIALVVGFVAFFLTNLGFGVTWWQSLILAGGGPGAILIHEMVKLIPVFQGKKPLPPSLSERPAPGSAEDPSIPPPPAAPTPPPDQAA